MKNTLKRGLLALLLGVPFLAHAQTDQDLNDKYWAYRDRFKNNFTVIGPDQGMSVPICTRRVNWATSIDQENSAIYYSDATIYLGHYIQVLATEYRLLANAGQETQATLNELYFALRTIGRLDLYAENYLYPEFSLGGSSPTNGLILRDDVPYGFALANFNEEYSAIFNTTAHFNFVHSDYAELIVWNDEGTAGQYKGMNPNNVQSLDQLLDIFTALYMTWKLVPDVVIQPTPEDAPMQLHSYLKNTVARFYSRLEEDNYFILEEDNDDHVSRGANCQPEAPMFHDITLEMVGGADAYIDFLEAFYGISHEDAEDMAVDDGVRVFGNIIPISHETIEGFWDVSDNFNVPISNNGFCFEIPAFGNNGPWCFFEEPMNEDNIHIMLQTATLAQLWSFDYIKQNAMLPENAFYWYPMLYSVLHENAQPLSLDQNFYRNFLASAPCLGPWADPNNMSSQAANGWASQSMLFHPDNAQFGPNDPSFRGEYNGLDYMLYHNLYSLIWNSNNVGEMNTCQCLDQITPLDDIVDDLHVTPKFAFYKEQGIAAPAYLSHDLLVHGANGKITLENDLIVCSESGAPTILTFDEGTKLDLFKGTNLIIKSGNKVVLTAGSVIQGLANTAFDGATTAKVIIEPGAELRIENGGELKLSHGLDIEIKDGGKLTVNEAEVTYGPGVQNSLILCVGGGLIEMNATNFIKDTNQGNLYVSLHDHAQMNVTNSYLMLKETEWMFDLQSEGHFTNTQIDMFDTHWTNANNSVVIFDGGTLNTVHVGFEIQSGSSATMNNNDLRLYDNSNIEIERINPSAEQPQLTLNCTSLVLQDYGTRISLMDGKIIVPNNKIISPEHPFGATGYIHFGSGSNNKIELGNNAVLKLHNGGNDAPMVVVDPESTGYIQGPTAQLNINNSQLHFGENALLVCTVPVYSFQTTAMNTGAESAIWKVKYYPSNFTQNSFAQVALASEGSFATISQSSFEGLLSGFSAIKTGYKVSLSSFHNCSILSNSLNQTSTITQTVFQSDDLHIPYAIQDRSIVEIIAHNNEIQGYGTGIIKASGKISLRCNTVSGNVLGLLGEKTRVNMSESDYAGHNHFIENNNNIHLNHAVDFNITKGFNELRDWNYSNIIGSVYGFCDQVCSVQEFDVTGNYWNDEPNEGCSVVYVGGNDCVGMDDGCAVHLHDASPVYAVDCPATKPFVKPRVKSVIQIDNPELRLVQTPGQLKSQVETMPIINTAHFYNVPLDSALGLAFSNTELYDSLANDLDAVALFHEILNADLNMQDDTIRSLVHWGVEHMKSAVENLFNDQELSAANNQTSFEPAVQQYVDVLNSLTTTSVDDSLYYTQFYLELNKGQLFKTIGKPETAYWVFQHLGDCAIDSLEQAELNMWRDIVLAEIDSTNLTQTIQESIDPETNDLATYRLGVTIVSPNYVSFVSCANWVFLKKEEMANHVRVYPNPSHGEFTLESAFWPEGAAWEVYDISGKKVFSSLHDSSWINSGKINLTALPAGLYEMMVLGFDQPEIIHLVID